MTIGLGV